MRGTGLCYLKQGAVRLIRTGYIQVKKSLTKSQTLPPGPELYAR